jgi:regulator of vacuolar morphogenesis
MSSDQLQAIYIRSYSPRSTPSPHIVYPIEVHSLPSRTWTVWRRYSSFVDLDADLARETRAQAPSALPPKHRLARLAFWTSDGDSDESLQERREALERYLRSILTHRDPRWRNSRAFREFLAVPIGKADHLVQGTSAIRTDFTNSSWLDEHSSLAAVGREIRADINRRDSLALSGSTTEAHQASVQAKKKLASLLTRLSVLAKGLEELGLAGMAEGELRRRTDLVGALQDEAGALGKLAVATKGRASASLAARDVAGGTAASSEARKELIPTTAPSKPTTRVLGAKAQETEITRPLDNTGLVQLQKVCLFVPRSWQTHFAKKLIITTTLFLDSLRRSRLEARGALDGDQKTEGARDGDRC